MSNLGTIENLQKTISSVVNTCTEYKSTLTSNVRVYDQFITTLVYISKISLSNTNSIMRNSKVYSDFYNTVLNVLSGYTGDKTNLTSVTATYENTKTLIKCVKNLGESSTIVDLVDAGGDIVISPPKGEKGDPGIDGIDGKNATFSIDSTVTLPPDQNANVENVGTTTDAKLKFSIPKGAKGDKGDKGDDGINPTIAVNNVNTVDFDQPAEVKNVGTENDVKLDFNIPKGEPGKDGIDGQSATITVGKIVTVDSDIDAKVTDTGNGQNAVFNFYIPKGKDGLDGKNGTDGKDGETGPQGLTGQDGKSATIKVGKVTTVDADKPAEVSNSGTDLNAVFDIAIPRGPQGIQGLKGDSGIDGQSATIDIDSVETVDFDQSADVKNTGTSLNAKFKFSIPQGKPGKDGISPTIKVGDVKTLDAGQPVEVNATQDNSDPSATAFNFGIPKGLDGKDGVNGQDGKNATIKIGKVDTLAPDAQATVTNSGDDTDAVFDIAIPQGKTGEKGDDGITPTIEIGSVTTGNPTDPAVVKNSGTSTEIKLDFTIPKGVDGKDGKDGVDGTPGEAGADGKSATIQIGKVVTLEPGENVFVNNTGSESDAVFNIGIPKGEKGDVGEKGETGSKGDKGDQGEKGEQGLQGISGKDGISPDISVGTVTTVDAGKQATVTATKDETDPGKVAFNFEIPQGEQGIQGNAGNNATIRIGEVKTLAPEEKVTIENTGDETNAVLNIGIPQGQKGVDGKSATIAVGTVTSTTSDKEPQVINSGDEVNGKFDFVIPKGEKGDQGVAGQDGITPTFKVGTVTTGNPTDQVTVTNSGTSSDIQLDFLIPKGQDGKDGKTGEQGPKGDSGKAGTIKVGNVTTLEPGSSVTVTNTGSDTDAVFDIGIPQGKDGLKGDKGDKGDKGNDGVSPTVGVGTVTTVDSSQSASIEAVSDPNDPGKTNFNFNIPKGRDGENGKDGETGKSATIKIGEVTTLNPGETAKVENTGTDTDAVFDIGIPQGIQGSKGDTGADGKSASVKIGNVTTVDPDKEAQVSNSGTDTDVVLDISIPKGATGEKGQDGVSPTIEVGEVTTLDPDKNASVTNSGTNTEIRLQFAIPRGKDGAKGEKGEQGEPFKIYKIYSSLDEMNNDLANIPDEKVVLISTENHGDAGNGKVYVKQDGKLVFIADLSGPTGIRGPKGEDGVSPVIVVGNTVTLDPDKNALVSMTKDENDPTKVILTFSIPKGEQGIQGEKGNDGANGKDGKDGTDGVTPVVTVGNVITGDAGSKASVTNSGTAPDVQLDFVIPKGDKGDTGPKGDKGDKGETGDVGATGSEGPKGRAATLKIGNVVTVDAGQAAVVTNTGTENDAVFDITLPRGAKGDTGLTGPAGQDGRSSIVKVDSTVTLPPDQPALVENVGDDKTVKLKISIPQGKTGDKGDTGAAGKSATLKVGNVTTLDAGQSATVTNTGSDTDAVFDIAIPKGEAGEQGLQGAKGDTGEAATIKIGEVTTVAPTESAAVTNIGDKSHAVLNIAIPQGIQGEKGDKGDTGPQGIQGVQGIQGKQGEIGPQGKTGDKGEKGDDGLGATISVGTVTTLAPGSEVSVENIGTATDVKLNFGIPKGDKGDKGDRGDIGATGTSYVNDGTVDLNVKSIMSDGGKISTGNGALSTESLSTQELMINGPLKETYDHLKLMIFGNSIDGDHGKTIFTENDITIEQGNYQLKVGTADDFSDAFLLKSFVEGNLFQVSYHGEVLIKTLKDDTIKYPLKIMAPGKDSTRELFSVDNTGKVSIAGDLNTSGYLSVSRDIDTQGSITAKDELILEDNRAISVMRVQAKQFFYNPSNSTIAALINENGLLLRSFPGSTVTIPQKIFSIEKNSSDGLGYLSNMSILDDGSMSLTDITSSRNIVAETITLQTYGKSLDTLDFRVKLEKNSITMGNQYSQYSITPYAFLIQTYPKDLAAFSQKTLFYVDATTGDIKSAGSLKLNGLIDNTMPRRPDDDLKTPLTAFKISRYDADQHALRATSTIDDDGNATFNTLTLTGSDGAMSLKSLKFVNGDTTYGSIASDTVSFTYDKLNISLESQGIQVNSNYDTPVTLFTATQKYKVTYSVRSDGYVTCNQLKADDSITGKSLSVPCNDCTTTIDNSGLTIDLAFTGNVPVINVKQEKNSLFNVQKDGTVTGTTFIAQDATNEESAWYKPGEIIYNARDRNISALYGSYGVKFTNNDVTTLSILPTGVITGKTISTMDASDSSNDLTDVPENALAFNSQTKNLVYRNEDGGLSPISCGEVQSENVISKAGEFGSTFTDIDSPANMGYFRVQGINGDNNTLEFPKYNGQHTIVCYGDENTSRVIKLFLLDNTFTSTVTTSIGVKYQYVGITLKPGDILKLTAISDKHDLDGKGYVYVAEFKECINAVNNPKVKNMAMPS